MNKIAVVAIMLMAVNVASASIKDDYMSPAGIYHHGGLYVKISGYGSTWQIESNIPAVAYDNIIGSVTKSGMLNGRAQFKDFTVTAGGGLLFLKDISGTYSFEKEIPEGMTKADLKANDNTIDTSAILPIAVIVILLVIVVVVVAKQMKEE